MSVEYELKFRATPEILLQLSRDIPEEAVRWEMETTYYDTPEQALSARWYTLRKRQENDLSVCTLKTPANGAGRNEYEVLCQDITQSIPELCKLSGSEELAELTAGGLVPVCGAKFTRLAKTVVLPDCTVELALDQGILTGGGKEIPLCEVEVELKSGTPQAAAAYATRLEVLYGLQPEKGSKFRRALALAKGEENG